MNKYVFVLTRIIPILLPRMKRAPVIEVTELMRSTPWFKQSKRYYLGVIQVHTPSQNRELVQDGQLYLITGPEN